MKKILIALTLMVFTSSAFAQTFCLGIKAGFNSSKITTSSYNGIADYTFNDFKSDIQNGYNIGGFARIGAKRLYFQPELLYSLKKGSTDMTLTSSSGSLPAGTYTQSADMKSIQIPFLLGMRLINLKVVSIRAFTGPAMSIILNSSQIKLTDSGGVEVPPSLYDPNTFKNNAWNWQLGGGVDIGSLVFDVRYEWGLTNVSTGDVTKIGFVNKGNSLTFSVGLKFL